jgi:hypothetical protein
MTAVANFSPVLWSRPIQRCVCTPFTHRGRRGHSRQSADPRSNRYVTFPVACSANWKSALGTRSRQVFDEILPVHIRLKEIPCHWPGSSPDKSARGIASAVGVAYEANIFRNEEGQDYFLTLFSLFPQRLEGASMEGPSSATHRPNYGASGHCLRWAHAHTSGKPRFHLRVHSPTLSTWIRGRGYPG